MLRFLEYSAWTTAFLICAAPSAFSQDAASAIEALDLVELERFADIARDGTDPRITASIPDASGRDDTRTRPTAPVLVSVEGEPAFVYTRGGNYSVPEGQLEFVLRCRGDNILDISVILSQLMGEPWEGITPEMDFELHIQAYGQDGTHVVPVRWEETYPSHQLVVRMTGAARADDPYFASLRGTTNFSYQLRKNGQVMREDGEFISLTGGIDFSSFRADVGPLLEHCRSGRPNPMDRELGPVGEFAESKAPLEDLPPEIGMEFLEQTQRRSFQRILDGESGSPGGAHRTPFLNYFAFHEAWWTRCGASSGVPIEFYSTTHFPHIRTIGIPLGDYETFVVAASVYGDVSRSIHDDAILSDFDFAEVSERSFAFMEDQKAGWLSVFSVHGCGGEVEEVFRDGVRRDLPFLEYRDRSRDVVVDFGGAFVEVRLPQRLNIERTKAIGRAEMETPADTIFTDSYPGRVLRSIAIGNFAQADREEAEFIEFVSNPLDWEENTFTKLIQFAMTIEASMRRQSNIMTAYAIGRMHILGSCGDPLVSYSQTRVYWTEYRNGLGQYVSSSGESSRTDYAELPRKFDPIIQRQSSITTSDLLLGSIAGTIGKMTCDSPIRMQLEDNMLAYFHGQEPAVIASLPGR